ncbi:unnamed protein product [Dovyalis caffra]|uniref:Uncharacterized protein n=1 Tax=Dovyalis caffra TaxID=77055 RepID=A0AAV1RYV1_9ROSI|nr:unnamed protein product [Dovyalis caffra]
MVKLRIVIGKEDGVADDNDDDDVEELLQSDWRYTKDDYRVLLSCENDECSWEAIYRKWGSMRKKGGQGTAGYLKVGCDERLSEGWAIEGMLCGESGLLQKLGRVGCVGCDVRLSEGWVFKDKLDGESGLLCGD